MIINDKRKAEGIVRFASLSTGDVFEYQGHFYCKISEKQASKSCYSAFDLTNSTVSIITSDTCVKEVYATLIIENYLKEG